MEEEGQHLDEILDRIQRINKLGYLKLLEDIKNLKKFEIQINSSQIQAQREIYENSKYDENENINLNEDEIIEKRNSELEKLNQLKDAYIKHTSCSNIIQDSIFQTQMQNNFHESANDRSPQDTELRQSIIANYTENIELSSKLSETKAENQQLKEENLDLRVTYRSLLRSIEEKWHMEKSKKTPIVIDSPEMKEIADKLQKRRSRIDIVVGLLQNMISGSRENWGENKHLLNILLLCDHASSQSESTEEARRLMNDIRTFHKD